MPWTIIGSAHSNGRRYYEVSCQCGYKGSRRADHVDSGRTTECKSCSARTTLQNFPNEHFGGHTHDGIGELGLTFWNKIVSGAAKRRIPFNITLDYVWALFETQVRRCALSGVDITLSSATHNGSPDYSTFTASLDRIDSSKGYVIGNVQWVHKVINRMKGSLPQDEFLQWCRRCGA